MRRSTPLNLSRHRGLTLIELLIVITIITALSVVVVLGAYRTGRTREALAQAGVAVALGQAIESAWTTHPDYSTLSNVTVAPFVPAAFAANTNSQGAGNGALLSAYGAITVGPTVTTGYTGMNPVFAPPTFSLQFSGLPQDLCPIFAGSASAAFDNVIINGNSVYAKVQGSTFNPGLAVQECNQGGSSGGNTVVFTRMRTFPVNTSGFCLVPTVYNPTPYSPASLSDPMWVWNGNANFTNSIDHTQYYTNPPLYDRLFAPDGTLIC